MDDSSKSFADRKRMVRILRLPHEGIPKLKMKKAIVRCEDVMESIGDGIERIVNGKENDKLLSIQEVEYTKKARTKDGEIECTINS